MEMLALILLYLGEVRGGGWRGALDVGTQRSGKHNLCVLFSIIREWETTTASHVLAVCVILGKDKDAPVPPAR